MKAIITYDVDQRPCDGRDITITYVGNDRAFASSFFNTNAFSAEVYENVHYAASRFAMFHYQLKLLHTHLIQDRVRFANHIAEPRMELEKVLRRRTPDRYIAKLDSVETLTCVHALFYLLKSFLDVHAQLLCRLITTRQSMSFKRKNKIAGGAFVDWLRNSAPTKFANTNALADLIEAESIKWITEAVGHRDILGHYSDIDDIHCQQVLLCKIEESTDPMYSEADMSAPRMPDGEYVEEYMLKLGYRLRSFARDTLALFPEINHKLLGYPEFDLAEPLWSMEPR